MTKFSQVDQETGFNRHEAKQRSVQRWREALEVEENGSDDLLLKCDMSMTENMIVCSWICLSRESQRKQKKIVQLTAIGAPVRQEAVGNTFWNGCGDYYQLYDKDEDR